jgi:hypothetical protein
MLDRQAVLILGLSAVGAASALLLTGESQAAPQPLRCAAPQPGRYAVMGQGEFRTEPVARLLQESWNADGSIQGVRLERRGRTYSEAPYSGSYRAISECRVAIQRSYGASSSTSQVVLDPAGYPRFSLGTQPDVVVASRWFRQPAGSCSAALLDGTVVSLQEGRSLKGGRWQPNAVVQHERWSGGRVHGIAIASYGSTIEEVTYKGGITVAQSCLATIRQVDSLSRPYNYRAIVLGDGGGYLYIQTDPDDLTVGWLQRVRSR